ncbi:MAG: hypothetical protein KC501_25040 [Myxococcales bacterium]|nr:hypothetical protein [Myxococcales bacterium]
MTCKPITLGDGFTAITCSRGARRRAAACDEPHCQRPHTRLCDYPVTRGGRPGTCDRKLCDGHAVRMGEDTDYCPAHSRLQEDS